MSSLHTSKFMRRRLLAALLASGLSACGGEVADGGEGGGVIPGALPGSPKMPALQAQDAQLYLAQIAPYLAGRELSPEELDRIDAEREGAIRPLVEAWTKEDGFAEAARLLVQQRFAVNGERDDIDFDLPGNLAAYIVKNGLPASALLTADFCVDAQGRKTACDTGAPFNAGILATRAYLSSRSSRFNLTRSSTLMKQFACRHYPMETELQPRLDKATLIPLFQATSAENQTDEGKGGFGNGLACYSCHGQFGAHAQVFVKFDQKGLYQSAADGRQDPVGELGRSFNGLMASHLEEPAAAASERSQVFGRQVANLREAAQAVADSPAFLQCQVRNWLEFVFALDEADPIDEELLTFVADGSRETADPTLQTLVLNTFSDPRVVKAIVNGMGGTP